MRFGNITDNSKEVKRGDTFVAIKGNNYDGHNFIDEAVRKGASTIIVENGFDKKHLNAEFIYVEDTRLTFAQLAHKYFGEPSCKMKIVGVTGTNGKTTVTHLLRDIYNKAGRRVGLIGTIFHSWGNTKINSENTTPEPKTLNSLLSQMKKDGVDTVVMEVSSHSLSQGRVAGVSFDIGVFTNISPEHLDYHRTFENYLKAKGRFFKEFLSADSTAIFNVDNPYWSEVAKDTAAKILTYGMGSGADIYVMDVVYNIDSTKFFVVADSVNTWIDTSLIGRFNVYNILACISVALQEQIPLPIIKEAILEFKGVEGRLELIDTDAGFKVFIDYAHTEDALREVITALRSLWPRRLIVLFGCGGNRDPQKRPKMGRVASELADFVVLTQDNSRKEDPKEIIGQIIQGFKEGFENYKVYLNRREAIKNALTLARSGDFVLIAGKGHEKVQIIGDEIIPFYDKEVVKECLKMS